MTKFKVRHASVDDAEAIYQLYLDVAKIPGGLARLEHEVSRDFVQRFISLSMSAGLIFIAEDRGKCLGEIHAYSPELFCFAHVLSELTIAVAPAVQGQGFGRILFQQFIDHVRVQMQHILRVELIARESNRKAIAFYESLGFQREGCFNQRIRNVDGTLESDIPMAWCREKTLSQYGK